MRANPLAVVLCQPVKLVEIVAIPRIRDEAHENRVAAYVVGSRRQQAQPLADAQQMRAYRERAFAELAEIEGRRCVPGPDSR